MKTFIEVTDGDTSWVFHNLFRRNSSGKANFQAYVGSIADSVTMFYFKGVGDSV